MELEKLQCRSLGGAMQKVTKFLSLFLCLGLFSTIGKAFNKQSSQNSLPFEESKTADIDDTSRTF